MALVEVGAVLGGVIVVAMLALAALLCVFSLAYAARLGWTAAGG